MTTPTADDIGVTRNRAGDQRYGALADLPTGGTDGVADLYMAHSFVSPAVQEAMQHAEPAGATSRAVVAPGRSIDLGLISRAKELIDSIDTSEPSEMPLLLRSLAGTVMDMWEGAMLSSEHHRDILATLENGVRATASEGYVEEAHLRVFREALADLAQRRLFRENAEIIRKQFVREGIGALAFLDSE